MNFSQRFASLLLLIVLILMAVLTAVYSLGLIPEGLIAENLPLLYKNYSVAVIAIVIAVLGIWAITPFFVKKEPANSLIQKGELGDVRVSLSAIEGLVQKVVSEQKGIKEVRTDLRPLQDGLKISLRVGVIPQMDIPHLTAQLQEMVKDYVTKTTGVVVSKVEILVRTIDTESTTKVE